MIEYTYDVQKLFLEMMMHDAQSFLRVQNIFNEEIRYDTDICEVLPFTNTCTCTTKYHI